MLNCIKYALLYQASFNHEKVGVKVFLLTKMLIFIVFNMLHVFLKINHEIYCKDAFFETSWGSLDQIVTILRIFEINIWPKMSDFWLKFWQQMGFSPAYTFPGKD